MTTAISTIPFSVPPLAPEVTTAAHRVLDSGWLTTGPECIAFEAELGAYLDQPYVVSVMSCTHALELSLRAMSLPAGSAVLTPSLTFSGAVAAIVHAGYRPVLADVDARTLTPSVETVAAAVARSGAVAAMVTCDLGGFPVDQAALADAAGLPHQRVVVDAAHGPGGDVGRGQAGTAPFATCLSFYATKNLPIGEGGAIATVDEDLADRLRTARLHGMSKDAWRRYLPGGSWRYDVPSIGLKANLTDLQAAIGRAQLAALPGWQHRRAELMARYDAALRDVIESGMVRLPERHPGHARHLYQIRVPRRDEVVAELTAAGIGSSVHFIPVHQLTAYAAVLGPAECAAVPVTDAVASELLSLPLYPTLTDSTVDLIAERLTTLLVAMNEGDGRV